MAEGKLITAAAEISKNLKLQKIHLWQSNCKRDISFRAKKAEVKIDIEIKRLNSDNKEILPLGCRFQLSGVDTENSKLAFEIDVEYCVVYSVLNNYKPQKEETEAFGRTSAVFNVWPYIREYVQNTLGKMDLAAFVMPPITISEIAKISKKRK